MSTFATLEGFRDIKQQRDAEIGRKRERDKEKDRPRDGRRAARPQVGVGIASTALT